MTELLSEMLAFPTVVFTMLLCVVAVYWVFVIAGALDLHVLEGLHGATHALDGASGGAVDAVHAHAHDMLDAAAPTALDALGIRGVPLTVWLSVFVLLSWALTLAGMSLAAPAIASLAGGIAAATVVVAVAMAASLLATAVVVRPLRKLSAFHGAIGHRSLVGRVCTVTTLRVDGRFGQAEIADGGAGLIVQVRCSEPNELTRGSQALIFEYDPEQGVFNVARFDDAVDARAVGRRLRTPD